MNQKLLSTLLVMGLSLSASAKIVYKKVSLMGADNSVIACYDRSAVKDIVFVGGDVKKVKVAFNDASKEAVSYDRSTVKEITFTEEVVYQKEVNGHTFVDMGTGTDIWWSVSNLGALTAQEYGDYYAWGETETKTEYSSSTYTYTDNPTTLPAEADAVTAKWGKGCRMPTQAEWQALADLGDSAWVWQSGTEGDTSTEAGYLITSPTTNMSIFLPAAGGYFNSSTCTGRANGGYYLASTKYSDTDAYYLVLFEGNQLVAENPRYYGYSVRAVAD